MSIHPTLRYDDPAGAIAFLTGALGFTEDHVYTDGGRISHADLGFDGGTVMIGARTDPPTAFDTGRACVYLALPEGVDVDKHHEAAVEAGATVVMELTDQPYGSREYAVTDPEGNVWSVGTYRP